MKKVPFSHKEKKYPSRSLQKTFRKRMRMNFEQKRKLLLFLKFLEGGGEEARREPSFEEGSLSA